jgi:hypothetical protein
MFYICFIPKSLPASQQVKQAATYADADCGLESLAAAVSYEITHRCPPCAAAKPYVAALCKARPLSLVFRICSLPAAACHDVLSPNAADCCVSHQSFSLLCTCVCLHAHDNATTHLCHD